MEQFFPERKGGYPGAVTFGKQLGTALFNLALDPGETYDVADQYPEVVQQLMEFVFDARTDLGDDLTNARGTNRREPALIR